MPQTPKFILTRQRSERGEKKLSKSSERKEGGLVVIQPKKSFVFFFWCAAALSSNFTIRQPCQRNDERNGWGGEGSVKKGEVS